MSAISRAETARSIRALAAKVEQGHPMEVTPGHLRDAARAVSRGNHEGARRHLIAAMHTFEPRSLMRHGVFTDDGHARGKQDLGAVHRQYLRVRDIQDEEAAAYGRRAMRQAGDADGRGNPTVIPARPIPAPAQQFAAEMIDLVGPKGWSHGWKRAVPGTFAAGTRPGSFEHLRAIDDLADRANSPEMAPGGTSPTMQVALHNVAKAIARRDLPAARAHLESAKWANRREAHGMWTKHLADLQAQIEQVPPGVNEIERGVNPLSRRAQHVGKYVPHPGPPANPTAGARVASYQAIAYAVPTTDQLREITAIALALSDDDVAIELRIMPPHNSLELSAKTGMLSTTPHPFGAPGGPGLWHVKGMELPPYIQNIARALLRTGRARNLSHAIAIARAATKRWSRGGGHVSPEVRAASAKTGAEWESKRATAHAHATPMELAFNPAEPRGRGGRWIAAGSGLADMLHGHAVVGRHASGKDVHGVYRGRGYVAPSNGGPPVKVTHVRPEDRATVTTVTQQPGGKAPPVTFVHHQVPGGLFGRRNDYSQTSARSTAARIRGERTPEERQELRALAQGEDIRARRRYPNRGRNLPLMMTDGGSAVIELFNPYHAPPGAATGGQFTTQQAAGQQQQAKQEGKHDAKQRQALIKRAASLRNQIAVLTAQLHAATTHRKSRSSTPAKKGAAATSAKQAAQAKATATKPGAATRKTVKHATPAQLRAQIANLRQQLHATLAALKRV